MVAYVKQSFALAVLLLLFVSSYARFSMMVTKKDVEFICTKKDINSSLCFEILKSTSEIATLDFPGLAKYLINYQYRNASDGLKQVKLFESNTKDLQSIKLCEELYGSVLYEKDEVLNALAGKDYYVLNMRVFGTISDMHTCSDELSTMKPIPQVLVTRSMLIEDISRIILAVIELFKRV